MIVYRQKLLCQLLVKIDDDNTASDLVRCVNVRDAIPWLNHTWDVLKDPTTTTLFPGVLPAPEYRPQRVNLPIKLLL